MLLTAILPRVEDPIPDTIGIGALFGAAGAGGVLAVVAGSMLGVSDAQQNRWARAGVSFGFAAGAIIYAGALIGQLL
ncbi:MAG TPA: hypothetical protein VFW48_07280 [Solirubrobacterales bacterium]|nr:hypothetical protein [Solirubrobacterales bacterium]